jgi:adenylate kinase family enzyme
VVKKVVIIGSSGVGKTMLARKLSRVLKIRVYHLDRLFWKRKWQGMNRNTRIDILQQIVMRECWIIEGTYLKSSEPRLSAADTIIFLDMPPWLCLWRAFQRHREWRGLRRCDIPKGCADKFGLRAIWKILVFPFQDRRKIIQRLRNRDSRQVFWLSSDEEVEAFLAWLRGNVDTVKSFSKAAPLSSGIWNYLEKLFSKISLPYERIRKCAMGSMAPAKTPTREVSTWARAPM